MRPKSYTTLNRAFGSAILILSLFMSVFAQAADSPIKVEVQLIWGTNDSKSPNPRHKPVEPAVLKKLKELPLKWNYFFEENRKLIEVGAKEAKKEFLSDKCALEVANMGDEVQVSLIGKGEPVVRRRQALPKGETLVLGGNAPNATAWLIVVKRLN
jgi:hypothetical protein